MSFLSTRSVCILLGSDDGVTRRPIHRIERVVARDGGKRLAQQQLTLFPLCSKRGFATIINYRLLNHSVSRLERSQTPIACYDTNRARRSATKRPMSSESADRELVVGLVGLLILCIPLLVLLVSSLGLIALKRISRLPRWAARLAAAPFYLVSLPIATVTAGLDLFTSISAVLYLLLKPYWPWDWQLGALILWDFSPVVTLLAGTSFAWMFVSAYLLWRTLRKEEEQGSSSKNAQRRRALLLLFGFTWAWGSVGYFVYAIIRP